jgi:hypothetical protein
MQKKTAATQAAAKTVSDTVSVSDTGYTGSVTARRRAARAATAPDVPEKMRDTRKFWEMLKTGAVEVVVSDVVFDD